MQFAPLLAALVAVLATLAAADVVDLTPKNFDKVIDGSKHALVEFFAPWCGHCKQLAPTYEELGQAYKHAGKDLVIAKVDADAHKELGARFEVQGFPTLKWFPKGSTKPEEYNSGRSLDDLASFIEGKTGLRAKIKKVPSHVTVLTTDNFDEMVIQNSKCVLVEFYAPWCGHCKSLAPTYEALGSTFSTEPNAEIAKVDATAHPSLGEKYGVQGYPTLKLFRAGAKTAPLDYNGGRTEADLVEFINKECGTNRKPGGGLNDQAGIVTALSDKIAEFMSASKNDRKAVLDAIKNDSSKILPKEATSSAKHYFKIMDKVIKSGEGYIEKEISRLSKLLADDSVVQAKKDLFMTRANILRTFEAALNSIKDEKIEL